MNTNDDEVDLTGIYVLEVLQEGFGTRHNTCTVEYCYPPGSQCTEKIVRRGAVAAELAKQAMALQRSQQAGRIKIPSSTKSQSIVCQIDTLKTCLSHADVIWAEVAPEGSPGESRIRIRGILSDDGSIQQGRLAILLEGREWRIGDKIEICLRKVP